MSTTTRPTTRRATERAIAQAMADAGLEGAVSVNPSDAGRWEATVFEVSAVDVPALAARLPWANVVAVSGLVFVV